MTVTPGRNTFGSVFAMTSVGSSGTFVTMGGIVSVSLPQYSRQTYDVTNFSSPDQYDEAITGGVIRSGNIDLSCIYIPTTTEAYGGRFKTELIPELMEKSSGQRIGWQIVLAGTSTHHVFYGDGYFTGYSVIIPQDGVVLFNTQIKVTGKPTLASTST